MVTPVLAAEQVGRTLTGDIPVTLLADVSLEIQAGEFVVITGPSGSGKSSLLYLLGLLDTPTAGKIWIAGEDSSRFDDRRRAEVRLSEIGFVFQFHFLLPEFTAIENVLLPMQRLGRLTAAQMRARAEMLLEQLGLKEHLHKRPKKLSGGQSQRVAIARALANDPRIILADEPTGNLDTHASNTVRGILHELVEDKTRAVIVVTHDPRIAENVGKVISVVDGRVANQNRERA